MPNKHFSTFLISAFLFSGIGYSRQAHAVGAGVIMMNPLVAIIGGGVSGVGIAGLLSGEGGCYLARLLGKANCSEKFKWINRGTFIAMIFVGVILEDNQDRGLMQFKSLNAEDPKVRQKLGVSESEIRAFNREVPKLNAINEILSRELVLLNRANLDRREKDRSIASRVEALWNSYDQKISQDSIKVVQAIYSKLNLK